MSVFAQLKCPVTAGLPTVLSAESWEKTCAAMRKPRPAYFSGSPTVAHKICSLCEGKHRPEELEIVDMAKQGKCEACGEQKTLNANRGKQICSSCGALYGAANNRPELVLQILKEMKPELFNAAPAQDNVSELERQFYHAQERADLAEQEAAALREELQEMRSKRNGSEAALLDVALAVIREEPIPANQIAVLIDAARGAR